MENRYRFMENGKLQNVMEVCEAGPATQPSGCNEAWADKTGQ